MSNNTEIFGDSTEAIKKKFEKDGVKWEDIKDKLSEIKKSEKKDSDFDKLKSIDDKYKYLKDQVKEDTKGLLEKGKDKIEKKADSIAESTIAKMEAEVTKNKGGFMGAAFGGIASFLFNKFKKKKDKPTTVMGSIGGIFKKILLYGGIMALGFFAGDKIWSKYGDTFKSFLGKEDKEDEEETSSSNDNSFSSSTVSSEKENDDDSNSVKTPVVTAVSTGIASAKEKVKDIEAKVTDKLKDSKESNEYSLKKAKAYKSIGRIFLKNISGIHFSETSGSGDIFNQIGNLKYKKIKAFFRDASSIYIKGGKSEKAKRDAGKFLLKNLKLGDNYNSKDVFDTVRSIVGSAGTDIIYEQRLSPAGIKAKLFDDKGKITKLTKNIFTEDEIIELKSSGLLDLKGKFYENLSTNIIAKLITISFSGLIVAGVIAAKNEIKLGFNYILDGTKEFIDDLKNSDENVLNKESINVLKFDVVEPNKHTLNLSIIEFEGFEKLPDIEKEKIKKFFEFKDELLKNIYNNSILNLGIDGTKFKESFKKGVTLRKIYLLYLSLDLDGSNMNFNNMNGNSVKKSVLYLWIWKVLENGNSLDNVAGEYIKKLGEERWKEQGTIFNDKDKKIIDILLERTLRFSDNSVNKTLSTIDGAVTSITKDGLIALHVPPEYAEQAARVLEVSGLVALILMFKNIYFRIFASALIVPIAYMLVSKLIYKGLDSNVQKELDKIVDDFAKKGKTLDINGKEAVTVHSMEDIKKFHEKPKEYEEKQKEIIYYNLTASGAEKKEYEKGKVPKSEIVVEINKNGLFILSRGRKFTIDTNFFSDKDLFSKVKYDGEGNFLFGKTDFKIPASAIHYAFDPSKRAPWPNGEYILKKADGKLPSWIKDTVGNDAAKWTEKFMSNFSNADIVIKEVK